MTSTHAHLPKLEDIKNQLETLGVENFHKHYSIYESFIGPSESMEFLENEIKKYEIHKKGISIHQPRKENL
jgi:hypothetical protein